MRHLVLATVAAVLCGGAWGEGLTARSYVQKGLLVAFDGIENAGRGVHDDSPSAWADLSGNGHNGTLGAGLAWGADGWSNATGGRPVTLDLAVSRALSSTRRFTVDFACRPAKHQTRGCFFSQYDGMGAAGAFAIEHNSSIDRRCGGLRFYQEGSRVNEYSQNAYAFGEEDVTLAMSVGPDERKMFKGGLLCDTAATRPLTAIPATTPCVVGGELARPQMAFRGTFHAFRLYARQLTEAELTINAAVDAVRYRHLPLEEVRLPEGAAFDAQTNILVRVGALARGAGTVSADSGPGVRICRTVRRLNDALKLTAMPARNGVRFVGWEGDVDLIQKGNVSAKTVVVSAARPFNLTAVFGSSGSGEKKEVRR